MISKLLLVDFDGTLTTPNHQGDSVVFHDALIAKLIDAQQAGSFLIGFTSYQVKFNLKMNLQMNNTRDHVIKACEERGLIFKAVITTASPFAEVINPEEYPFGQYYFKEIQPIEQAALAYQTLESRNDFIASCSAMEAKYLDKEADIKVLELRQGYRQLDEAAYQKGKEEMFRYVRNVFPEAELEIYDDNEVVIRVAKEMGIKAHPVRFTLSPLMPVVMPINNSESGSGALTVPDGKKIKKITVSQEGWSGFSFFKFVNNKLAKKANDNQNTPTNQAKLQDTTAMSISNFDRI